MMPMAGQHVEPECCLLAGGGAATFDNMGVPTGKAHPDNQPKPASATAGAYPTSGSSVTDPSADLTSPAGAPYMRRLAVPELAPCLVGPCSVSALRITMPSATFWITGS